MTEKELLVRSLTSELPITIKVMKAVPEGQIHFKPHERSGTSKQIVETMIAEMKGIKAMLAGDELIFEREEVDSMPKAIEMYEKAVNGTIKAIANAPAEDLDKALSGMMGKFFPRRADGMWAFANDAIHHRGQLSVYIRLSGGKVPSIYGPSADENPFQKIT